MGLKFVPSAGVAIGRGMNNILIIIIIAGIVGNVCTCMVIALNAYMQTATNCYLFNLAIADMLTLLCGMYLMN